MSGELAGEVNRNGGHLRAAGVPKAAVWTLSVVAECCRAGTRQGPAPLHYLASATCSGERTASRNLATLRRLGLVQVLRRGGGRGRAGVQALYRIVELGPWLAEHGQPFVATQSAAMRGTAADDGRSGGHDGGDSIEPDPAEGGDSIGVEVPEQRADGDSIPDSPATTGDSMAPDDSLNRDPVATSDRLSRQPGGDLPGVPGKDLYSSTDVTTGPREVKRRAMTAKFATACGACSVLIDAGEEIARLGQGWAHAVCALAAGDRAALTVARSEAALAERRAAALARAAAIAACGRCNTRGYVGRLLCDHQAEVADIGPSAARLEFRAASARIGAQVAAKPRDPRRPVLPAVAARPAFDPTEHARAS